MKECHNLLGKLKLKKETLLELKQSQVIKKAWSTIVGDVLTKDLHFSFLKNDTCVIQINNPCWHTEILYYEKKILDNLNAVIKQKKKIKHLKLTL